MRRGSTGPPRLPGPGRAPGGKAPPEALASVNLRAQKFAEGRTAPALPGPVEGDLPPPRESAATTVRSASSRTSSSTSAITRSSGRAGTFEHGELGGMERRPFPVPEHLSEEEDVAGPAASSFFTRARGGVQVEAAPFPRRPRSGTGDVGVDVREGGGDRGSLEEPPVAEEAPDPSGSRPARAILPTERPSAGRQGLPTSAPRPMSFELSSMNENLRRFRGISAIPARGGRMV
jgi:hypothetical protein